MYLADNQIRMYETYEAAVQPVLCIKSDLNFYFCFTFVFWLFFVCLVFFFGGGRG